MRKSLVLFTLLTLLVFSVIAEASSDPLNIYFFTGGQPGCPFGSIVYKGAQAAEEMLGDKVKINYVFSDWLPEKMVKQFQEAVATNPDGIAIMGHPGDDALEPFVDEAIEKGIIVTSQNTDLPRLEEEYQGKGFGYVGQSLYEAGYLLGSAASRESGLGEGDKAMVWGLLSQPIRGQRAQGIIDALEDAGMEVDYLEISMDVTNDAVAGIPVITGYLSQNKDCDMVVADQAHLVGSFDIYFEEAGFEPDEIYGAGFDLSPAIVNTIRSGYTDLVLDQQPFLQGFLPIFQIYLTKTYGFSGLHIDTGSGLVTKANIEQIAPLIDKGLR